MDFLKYINPGIESINPYEAGKSIEEVMEKYNLEDIVKLASNENNSGPSPRALKVIKYFKDLHIYPDGDAINLNTKISEVDNVELVVEKHNIGDHLYYAKNDYDAKMMSKYY